MNRANGVFFGSTGLALNAVPIRPARHLGSSRRRLGQNQFGATNLVEALRQHGPILPVQIGVPDAMAEQMRAQGQTPPAPEEIAALVDTGASITAINVATAQRLGLVPTGSIQIAGATGVATKPVFAAKIRFTDPDITYGAMRVGGADLHAPNFEILIGRDVLCHIHLAYDGRKGQFSLIV